LVDFTEYAHQQIIANFKELQIADQRRYLVDAYCGSGLFSITCSEGFESVVGVEISADSVQYAIRNAKANNIANASFITGSADEIFKVVKTPPDRTALIIDPPRKVLVHTIDVDQL
jgi:tRNA (uracil-5-)-methyltransferase